MRSFITGSRAYGTQKADSDVDLVLFVSPETKKTLLELSDWGDYPIRFGDLNLVCVTSEEEWAAWKLATKRCRDKAQENGSLTKEEAIKIHEHSRKVFGVREYKSESGSPEDRQEAREKRRNA